MPAEIGDRIVDVIEALSERLARYEALHIGRREAA
jgi:hypothetical protein